MKYHPVGVWFILAIIMVMKCLPSISVLLPKMEHSVRRAWALWVMYHKNKSGW